RIAAVALLTISACVYAADKTRKLPTSTTISEKDRTLIQELAQANLTEIEIAKLAQDKSSNKEIVDFAAQMRTDHHQALQELKTLAKSRRVSLPLVTDEKNQAILSKLKALDGTQFDQEYIS